MTIDQWEELEPARPSASTATEPVVIATIRLRGGAARVSFSLAEGIAAQIGWPRYAVAYNPDRRQFRIRATETGRFEGFRPIKGTRVVIRCPLPATLVPVEKLKIAAAHEMRGRELFVTVPSAFWPKPKPAAAAAADMSRTLMGDPPAGRSALDRR